MYLVEDLIQNIISLGEVTRMESKMLGKNEMKNHKIEFDRIM